MKREYLNTFFVREKIFIKKKGVKNRMRGTAENKIPICIGVYPTELKILGKNMTYMPTPAK